MILNSDELRCSLIVATNAHFIPFLVRIGKVLCKLDVAFSKCNLLQVPIKQTSYGSVGGVIQILCQELFSFQFYSRSKIICQIFNFKSILLFSNRGTVHTTPLLSPAALLPPKDKAVKI